MTEAGPTLRRKPQILREPEQQSTLSYVLQGSAFIAILLLLFLLAGFRG